MYTKQVERDTRNTGEVCTGHLAEIANHIHSTCNTIDFTVQNLVNLGDRIFGPSPGDMREETVGIDTTPAIDKLFVALGRLDTMARDLEVTATRLYSLA